MFRNKVQPVPPFQPREVVIARNPWKRRLKWTILSIILVILGIGVWLGYTANQALKNISDGSNKQSIFSFLGDFNSGDLKGRSQGRTNILILGYGGKNHPGGLLTDTMIVVSINYEEKKVGMISIPRDLWAPIQGFGHAKINEAYHDGENSIKTSGGGGVLASRTVENILGIPIHYYVSMDFEGFEKIVDTVGGVDIYVEKEIYDPYFPAPNMVAYQPFRISAGLHHMDGELALKYARSRKTTSDFDRSRRQMQVMAAVREKLLSLDILANPKKIADLLNILGDNLRTNMQPSEIRSLLDVTKTLDMTNIINKVLDTTSDGLLLASQDSRGYFVYPRKGIDNFSEIQNLARNLFIPEETDVSLAKIQVSNAAGRRGLASSVAHYLESYGYSITKIDNAEALSAKTIVYDYSGGKYSSLAEKITTLLGAQSAQGQARENIDIQVSVGQDYLSNQ